MIDPRIYEQFRDIGRDLYVANMISSHAGNLSIRLGDRLIIKRRGAMLGQLKPHDLIETGIEKNDSGVALASSELLAHRIIYMNTPALAHPHGPAHAGHRRRQDGVHAPRARGACARRTRADRDVQLGPVQSR